MKPKRVKCIRGFTLEQVNDPNSVPITGQVYTVIGEDLNTYRVGTHYDSWSKDRFIIVGCPCNVSECVAHKKV